ncbi:hypothetical protein [Cytobacillus dafuensis]|uniref:Uncharacterized protein n=1 Tax=Cytobacillus dafuensis TaxID=1742359 RepID=A0A5B8Z2V4_CYTDA|nr:hypothetical protein [Cytobacillus dafuensis]QED47268.1 hypothetical protein FSZ17_08435 [Cytobacillus dafuensis]
MKSKAKLLNTIKYVGGIVLTIGIITFLLGIFERGSSVLTPIGIGTVMGAIFIFLMGVFFVATEEMLEKMDKGIAIAPMKIK